MVASLELAAEGTMERRLIDAARDCCATYGWAKTTVDDVARTAGLSRATLYRVFPGGRETLMAAVNRHETIDFLQRLDQSLSDPDDLEALLTDGLHVSARMLADDADLQFALEHEPGQVLPSFAFRGLDGIFALTRAYFVPRLVRHLPEDEAGRVAELLARLVVIHLLESQSFVDLSDRDVAARLVRTRIMPGLSVHPVTTS
jgi:AcrR family transcriptional regulator